MGNEFKHEAEVHSYFSAINITFVTFWYCGKLSYEQNIIIRSENKISFSYIIEFKSIRIIEFRRKPKLLSWRPKHKKVKHWLFEQVYYIKKFRFKIIIVCSSLAHASNSLKRYPHLRLFKESEIGYCWRASKMLCMSIVLLSSRICLYHQSIHHWAWTYLEA